MAGNGITARQIYIEFELGQKTVSEMGPWLLGYHMATLFGFAFSLLQVIALKSHDAGHA